MIPKHLYSFSGLSGAVVGTILAVIYGQNLVAALVCGLGIIVAFSMRFLRVGNGMTVFVAVIVGMLPIGLGVNYLYLFSPLFSALLGMLLMAVYVRLMQDSVS